MKRVEIVSANTVTAALDCNNWDFPQCAVVNFSISHSCDAIELRFDTKEQECRAVTTHANGPVWQDSCVEFFISFDNRNYFNIECNCIGVLHAAWGPNREQRKLLPESLLQKIIATPSLGHRPLELPGTTRWSVALKIPAAIFSLSGVTSLSGVRARANFYKCGDHQKQPHYLSWSPIQTKTPDFHCPEFFGELYFSG
ncbi:MAG: carbohydrate-binding family 9-like protein [Desulforhopalus sp.]|nr:carbohydrate-binding family 9-like protein [Desulforhopalus sp.]